MLLSLLPMYNLSSQRSNANATNLQWAFPFVIAKLARQLRQRTIKWKIAMENSQPFHLNGGLPLTPESMRCAKCSLNIYRYVCETFSEIIPSESLWLDEKALSFCVWTRTEFTPIELCDLNEVPLQRRQFARNPWTFIWNQSIIRYCDWLLNCWTSEQCSRHSTFGTHHSATRAHVWSIQMCARGKYVVLYPISRSAFYGRGCDNQFRCGFDFPDWFGRIQRTPSLCYTEHRSAFVDSRPNTPDRMPPLHSVLFSIFFHIFFSCSWPLSLALWRHVLMNIHSFLFAWWMFATNKDRWLLGNAGWVSNSCHRSAGISFQFTRSVFSNSYLIDINHRLRSIPRNNNNRFDIVFNSFLTLFFDLFSSVFQIDICFDKIQVHSVGSTGAREWNSQWDPIVQHS